MSKQLLKEKKQSMYIKKKLENHETFKDVFQDGNKFKSV